MKWDKVRSPTYAAAVTARIKAGGIVDRLHKHVLGTVEMSASQVTAAIALLRKVVPDKTESKTDLTVRRIESLGEEQARLMAQSYIAQSQRSAALSETGADPVHDSVPTGLPPG